MLPVSRFEVDCYKPQNLKDCQRWRAAAFEVGKLAKKALTDLTSICKDERIASECYASEGSHGERRQTDAEKIKEVVLAMQVTRSPCTHK
jgi:hypothetical protein